MSELYIGMISGTSMDGIDAALVDCSTDQPRLVDHYSHDIPVTLREQIYRLAHNDQIDLQQLGETDAQLGETFGEAAMGLLKKTGHKAADIRAIGSHGQTIWHQPKGRYRFSMQIGDANRIAFQTHITTVTDFRRKDMAAGGEGAPLAPALHKVLFHSPQENRAVLNIGGISNLTYLPADRQRKSLGFDCGPGNVLMDAWISQHLSQAFDHHGSWAASATADDSLVGQLMQDPYLQQPPPKSTGREHYHMQWLNQQLKNFEHLTAETVQASLCEFTVASIKQALELFLPPLDSLIVCGGGSHNRHLMQRLQSSMPETPVASSEQFGLHPDWVEAVAFAWFAQQTLLGHSLDLKDITGAGENRVAGAIYPA